MTLQDAIAEAAARGTATGLARIPYNEDGGEAPRWLSGEWAGESVTELLGDLLEAVPCTTPEEEEDAYTAITEAFEMAADEAFYLA